MGRSWSLSAESQHWKQLTEQKQVPECSKLQITWVNIILSADIWSNSDFQRCYHDRFLPWSHIQLFRTTRAKQLLSCLQDFDVIWRRCGREIQGSRITGANFSTHRSLISSHSDSVLGSAAMLHLSDRYIWQADCCYHRAKLPSCGLHNNTISPRALKRRK